MIKKLKMQVTIKRESAVPSGVMGLQTSASCARTDAIRNLGPGESVNIVLHRLL